MKGIYTAAAQLAFRTVTLADMRASNGTQKLVQVTANTADEAITVEEAGHRHDDVEELQAFRKSLASH